MRTRRLLAGALAAALLVPALPSAAGADDDEFLPRFPHRGETTFSNDWGDARSEGRSHRGNDLMSPKMTPIVAIADGVVERMATGRPRSGNYIVISHADGWSSWYIHLNNDTPGTDDGRATRDQIFAPDLAVGDPVRAGQLIAFVGDSGNAEGSGPHTHFELHRNGRAINPYPYLVGAFDRWQLQLAIEAGETPFR